MEQSDLEERYLHEIKIHDSKMVNHEMRDIKNWGKEVFVAFYLNTRNNIVSREILSIGTLDMALLHPREVFRTAIIRNAKSVILSHNHPSGSIKPSDEDIEITKQLKKAGDLLQIKLLDHVIVSKSGHYSFSENNMI